MRVTCDCDNAAWHIDVDLFREDAVGIFGTAECTECGLTVDMSDSGAESVAARACAECGTVERE